MSLPLSAMNLEKHNQRMQLLADVTYKIRQSLDLHEILQTTVTEVRQLLDADRVVMFQIHPDGAGTVVQEAVLPGWSKSINQNIVDTCFGTNFIESYRNGRVSVINNIEEAPITPCHADLLRQFEVKANLVIPIISQGQLWGLLIAHQCSAPRVWQDFEVDLLKQLADQAGIALAQAKLLADLNQAHQQLRFHVENSPLAVIEWDHACRIQRWSAQAERIFGWSAEEVTGRGPDHWFIHTDDLHLFREHVLNLTGHPFPNYSNPDMERLTRNYTKTGDLIDCEWYSSALFDGEGNLVSILSMAQDVSARQQAEVALQQLNRELEMRVEQRTAALQESEQRFRSLFEAAPDFIYVLDTQGVIQHVNPVVIERSGYRRSELEGHPFVNLFAPKSQVLCQQQFSDLLVLGSHRQELEFMGKNGAILTVDCSFKVVKDPLGQKSILVVQRDISDRKALERIKDEFISVVSHELRTPLTSIHGSIKLLATGQLGDLSDDGQQMLDIADQNTDRLVRLVSDVLDLQRIESGQAKIYKQLCDAADLMTHATDAMRSMAYHHNVTLKSTPLLTMVWANPDYMVQTLTNLLSNAIKFSQPGGTVELAAELRIEERRAKGSPSPPEGQDTHFPITIKHTELWFQVIDQGQGIPADKLESVFERFQQVDASDAREKGGTGLGLAICRKIVEQHGGKIWAESVLGQGSCFFVALPMSCWLVEKAEVS
ncbi:PAS domain S-box protein [Acaryochloris marina]|uniref:PAS domain S-box protein n=1 Tax=Acaryochloris marina TaxID=155978 RepID=UPI001BB08496|nr:PAS domain S-box protein [Acaryochloris marina]QUY40904.1 PAS domain S-box protein [Acaryochloris marina S15]